METTLRHSHLYGAVNKGGSDLDTESTSASIPGDETGAFVYKTPMFLMHRHAGRLE